MRYDIYLPVLRLQPYVKHLVISESGDEVQTYRVLPDTALVVGFQYRGSLSVEHQGQQQLLQRSGITGLLHGYRTFCSAPRTGTVLVMFTETGAAHFTRLPLHELFEQSTALLNCFNTAEISSLEDRLNTARHDRELLRLVQSFLLSQLIERPADKLVTGALGIIHQCKGTVRIVALAQMLNTSASPLEKRFRAMVGASPKKFANIVRARHTLMAIEQNRLPLAEQLLAYYDQAHFIKDFKQFSSYTPEQYLAMVRRRKQS